MGGGGEIITGCGSWGGGKIVAGHGWLLVVAAKLWLVMDGRMI